MPVKKNVEVEESEAVDSPVTTIQRKTKKEIDPNRLVTVMSMPVGRLIYKSIRTGELYYFEQQGETQDMTLGELKNMKASQQRFLIEPWILILDDEIVEYLGLTKLYENILTPNDVDNFLALPDDKITEYIANAPRGIKDIVATKALELVNSGNITITKKNTLELALGVKLTTNEV